MRNLLLVVTLLCGTFLSQAQVLVNRSSVADLGQQTTIVGFRSTDLDEQGNFYTASDIQISGFQEDFAITRYNADLTKAWEVQYNNLTNGTDYGTDIYATNGYVYVTGVSIDSGTTISRFTTLKLDTADGSTIWSATYSAAYSGYAVPTRVRVDGTGNVYVAGTEQTDSTDYAMTLVKYNSAGTEQWVAHYDSIGFYDGAAALAVGSYISITGFSGTAYSSWDFATASFDPSTGALYASNRAGNGSGSFSKPVDLIKDETGNLFVLGTSQISGTNTDIKLIKYDDACNELWVRTWGDSLLPDVAEDMEYEVRSGKLVVTGTVANHTGGTDMVVVKYDTAGTKLWEHVISNPNPAYQTSGKVVSITDNGDPSTQGTIYLAGKQYNGSDFDLLTLSCDTGGAVRWLKTYNRGSSLNEEAYSLLVSDGATIVLGASKGVDTMYFAAQYDEWNSKDSVDTTSLPLMVHHEIIVRFDPSVFDTTVIQNLGLTFFSPNTVFTSSAFSQLNGKMASNLAKCTVSRVFTDLNPKQTTCISRLGETITLPDFWTTMVIKVPDIGWSENRFCDSLNTLFPLVRYAHPNYVALQLSEPNDYNYSRYQYSLHSLPLYPNANINIEPAWEIEKGKPSTRIGVFDGGIGWTHFDFGYNGVTPTSSRVVDGWDFQNQHKLKIGTPGVNSQDDAHANGMAGIIGAVSNDSGTAMYSCIAGIAGGFYEPAGPYDTSVSLYGLTIFAGQQGGMFIYSSLKYIADAIAESSIDSTGTDRKFGLHVMNHSWGIDYNDNQFVNFNIQILNDAVHFANRAKVVVVAARGNNDGNDSIVYPACYDDDWVLNIGGTGQDGNYKTSTNGLPSTATSIGRGIDLAAPAASNTISTLISQGGCGNVGQTSGAAAHVSGVAGLLISYMNAPEANYKNLAPEDVEFILQKTATDVVSSPATTGYDDYTGYGRLNAGAALQLVQAPYHHLYHFGTDSFANTKSVSLYSASDSFYLTEPYPSVTSAMYGLGKLYCDVYSVSANVQHSIPVSDSILYAWERHSSSTPIALYDANRNLAPHEKVHISSVGATSANLFGYIYHIKNPGGGYSGWIPFDTALVNQQFAYSILTTNTTITEVPKIQKDLGAIRVYPNPSETIQTIVIDNEEDAATVTIVLFDMQGRVIKQCYSGKLTKGTNQFNVDISILPQGVYFYKIQTDKRAVSKLISKM